ncbi:ankyrin repeat-containing domain protein [Mycena latifolia]|nr:ankyrin repeat-containing domain protein [Mycena latifolia]
MRTSALERLEVDLRRYEIFLREVCDILSHWTSQSFAKRVWSYGDFPGIADSIDGRLDAFHDAFNIARLLDLLHGQNVLDKNMQTLVNGETRRNLKEWLKPADVAVSEQDAANKRHPETGKWLLERAEFKEWIYAPRSLLWLHGISGSGKTVLSSTIIKALRNRTEPVVFFYFDTNNSGQRTVTQLLRLLVTQLSVQADSPDKTLSGLWKSHANGQHLPSDSVLISDALIPILTEFNRPVYIVLDALDECSEREKLLDSLIKILEAAPSNIHLLLTSRPEVLHGTELVQRAVSLSLEGCVDEDIKSYITDMVSKLGDEWTDERKDQIRLGLLECSNGMFRLAALQLDQVLNCDGRESQVTKALSEMPTSLETLYNRILQDIADPDMVSAVGCAIIWLMFSKCPMKLGEIIDTMAFDFDRQPLRFNPAERMRPKALLAVCGGLLTVSGNKEDDTEDDKEDTSTMVKLAHASVNEYFLSANKPRELYGDSAFMEPTGHLLIARTCIAYLCSFDYILTTEADLQQYPLALYAAHHWVGHVKLCHGLQLDQLSEANKHHGPQTSGVIGIYSWLNLLLFSALAHFLRIFVDAMRVDRGGQNTRIPATDANVRKPRQLIEAILDLFRRDSVQHMTLCRLHDFDGIHWKDGGFFRLAPILPPLYMSALVGIGQVVMELLKQGDDVNEKGGHFNTALQAASYHGHIHVVWMLLQHGADVNMQGGAYSNALQAASSSGHADVAHLLIEHGAEVNMEGGEYGTALQAASYCGHTDVACLLIEHGADVNAQGGQYGNALQVASHRGKTNVMCLLIAHGADINAQDRQLETALQGASYRGQADVVHLLLDHGADVNAQGGEYGNALQAACYYGYAEVVHLLIDHGADVNTQGGTYGNALQAASTEENPNVARLLLEHGADIHAQGGKYGNALQAACYYGYAEVVHLLLEHGADVNAMGGQCGTALQAASAEGEITVVHLLLDHRADVNIQGGIYGSALQAAMDQGHTEVVQLLSESGAVLSHT